MWYNAAAGCKRPSTDPAAGRGRKATVQVKRVCRAIALLVCVLPAGAGPAGAADGDAAKLTYTPGLRCYTRSRVLKPTGRRMLIRSSAGRLKVGSDPVTIKAAWTGRSYVLAVDANDDGKYTGGERAVVGRSGTARLEFTLGAGVESRDCRLLLTDLGFSRKSKELTGFSGYCFADFGMRGSINGTQVLLIDDDLDGEYTQAGQDAILIGRAIAAVPLRERHLIGKDFYDLSVDADGSKVGYAKCDDLEVGTVVLPFKCTAMKCMVLESDQGAYDVLGGGKAQVPPGDYKLSYAAISAGGKLIDVRPSKMSPTYRIKASHENKIRIGPPLTVFFSAAYGAGKIAVSPTGMRIYGAGAERYDAFLDNVGRPLVRFLVGQRKVHEGRMSFT